MVRCKAVCVIYLKPRMVFGDFGNTTVYILNIPGNIREYLGWRFKNPNFGVCVFLPPPLEVFGGGGRRGRQLSDKWNYRDCQESSAKIFWFDFDSVWLALLYWPLILFSFYGFILVVLAWTTFPCLCYFNLDSLPWYLYFYLVADGLVGPVFIGNRWDNVCLFLYACLSFYPEKKWISPLRKQ